MIALGYAIPLVFVLLLAVWAAVYVLRVGGDNTSLTLDLLETKRILKDGFEIIAALGPEGDPWGPRSTFLHNARVVLKMPRSDGTYLP